MKCRSPHNPIDSNVGSVPDKYVQQCAQKDPCMYVIFFPIYILFFWDFHVYIHSLKLTVAPENRPGPERKRMSSNHLFSGANLLLASGRVSIYHTLHGSYGGLHHETTETKGPCVESLSCQDPASLWALPKLKKDLITSTGRGWEGRSYKQSPTDRFVCRKSPGWDPSFQSYDHPGWDLDHQSGSDFRDRSGFLGR